jgi:predicted amidohydrolase YtcJ
VAKMLQKGIKVSAGTDATRVASYNLWVSLAWLVTGKTVAGMGEAYLRRTVRSYITTNGEFIAR